MRVEADGSGAEVMKLPIAHYVNADGQRVDLVGAVHIAERSYYRELNKRFLAYDRVLYEMVDGEDLAEFLTLAKKVKAGAASPQDEERFMQLYHKLRDVDSSLFSSTLSRYYKKMAKEMGLVMQSSGIDYGHPHFVYADMSQDEFNAAMKQRGESWLSVIWTALKEEGLSSVVKQITEGAPRVSGPQGRRREFLHMAKQSGDSKSMDNLAIIQARNARCFDVFDRVRQEAGVGSIAIFYGTMHLRDMDARLRERGYRLTGVEWLDAVKG